MLHLLGQAVMKSIQFHGQLCGGTIEVEIEVEIVVTQLVLAAEFEAGKPPRFQRLPELLFFVGLVATQHVANRTGE